MQKIKEMLSGKDDTPEAIAANQGSKDYGHTGQHSSHTTGAHRTGDTPPYGPDYSTNVGGHSNFSSAHSTNTGTTGTHGTNDTLGDVATKPFGHLEGQTRPNDFENETGTTGSTTSGLTGSSATGTTGAGYGSTTGTHGHHNNKETEYAGDAAAVGAGTHHHHDKHTGHHGTDTTSSETAHKESMGDKLKHMMGGNKHEGQSTDTYGTTGTGYDTSSSTTGTGTGFGGNTTGSGFPSGTGIGSGSSANPSDPTGHALTNDPLDHKAHHVIPLAEKLDPHISGTSGDNL